MSSWEADADLLHKCGAKHALILSQTNSALAQLAGGIARALAAAAGPHLLGRRA